MDRIGLLSLFVAFACLIVSSDARSDAPPPWAYPANPPGFKPSADDGTVRRVPGSSAGYTLSQVRDLFLAPDWHPSDYPLMPDIVARGRKPDVFACGFCHRADGPGGPENANLTGLPASYMVRQMLDFQSGARKSAVPNIAPQALKARLAKAITQPEIEAAAAYFAAIKPRSIVRVVEADMVPQTSVSSWFMVASKSGEMEPIGQRIIEVPEDVEQFVSRDTRARFIAYVPPGSIQKGEALAQTGGGKTVPCDTCHGPGLKGVDAVPGIAGRSPSYMVRQLWDYKFGARAGVDAAQMKPSVEKLSIEDMIVLAAYAASLRP